MIGGKELPDNNSPYQPSMKSSFIVTAIMPLGWPEGGQGQVNTNFGN